MRITQTHIHSIIQLPNSWLIVALALGTATAPLETAKAQVSYTGGLYTQNFDSLPTDAPQNGSIEAVYVDGWRDNVTTLANTHVSLPGWYLFHPLSPATENGFNGNQRLRFGPGANTGAFWAFGSAASATDKALGSVGSLTVAADNTNMSIAVRLINNTASTLTEFTVTYDGEQWRDGQSTSPETLLFDYSLTAIEADWFSTGVFTSVAGLNFSSPVFTGISSGGTAVDGNTAGRVADITATISGISWVPGTELWLRWGDPQLPSNADDGLAIDNLRFSATAVPEPATWTMLMLGLLTLLGLSRRKI